MAEKLTGLCDGYGDGVAGGTLRLCLQPLHASNLGGDIAFWVDNDISVGGANADAGLGDAYLKFVHIGRVCWEKGGSRS